MIKKSRLKNFATKKDWCPASPVVPYTEKEGLVWQNNYIKTWTCRMVNARSSHAVSLKQSLGVRPVIDELVTWNAHALVAIDLMQGRRAVGIWVLSSRVTTGRIMYCTPHLCFSTWTDFVPCTVYNKHIESKIKLTGILRQVYPEDCPISNKKIKHKLMTMKV